MATPRSNLAGLILLDKPFGLSSTQALYQVRRLCGQRKSGHAGTLDPTATGLLILCLGGATKLVEALMHQPKVYRATARLDITSPGYDQEGEATPVAVQHVPTQEQVLAASAAQVGEIMQVPPATSALKVGGEPAYQRARRDEPVELPARPVVIYWLHVHRYAWPELDFELACGRGTYVRSVIRDLGTALHTGGSLTSLRRTRIGPFGIDEAHTLEAIERASSPDEYVVPLDRARALAEKPVDPPPAP